MDFFLKHLKETLEAVNKLIERNIFVVSTKRVRRCQNVKSSDRSKINFIWRSLQYLEKEGILEKNSVVIPKQYAIKPREVLDINRFIVRVEKGRSNAKNL